MIPKMGYIMADETKTMQFLQEVKYADIIDFIPTDKNLHIRLSIGLSAYEQKELVRNLKVDEYYSGLSNDINTTRPGMIWVLNIIITIICYI